MELSVKEVSSLINKVFEDICQKNWGDRLLMIVDDLSIYRDKEGKLHAGWFITTIFDHKDTLGKAIMDATEKGEDMPITTKCPQCKTIQQVKRSDKTLCMSCRNEFSPMDNLLIPNKKEKQDGNKDDSLREGEGN